MVRPYHENHDLCHKEKSRGISKEIHGLSVLAIILYESM
jgi:hypothetical protein